jgi:cell division transport system ATP-binding protein
MSPLTSTEASLRTITGGDGAGKTTLLKLLFAMERATEGTILVKNRDLSITPEGKVYQYRREVGFVFQDFKLLPDLTIYENVSLPLEIRKMTRQEVDYRVRGVLSSWDLATGPLIFL